MKTTAIMNLARIILANVALSAAAHAAVLIPADVAAWDRGAGAANGTGNGGILKITSDQTNMNLVDPADPSTWLTTTRNWTTDFQGQDIQSASLTTNPWIIFDLGADTTDLENLYIWNVSEATGWQRGTKTFNLHYSTTPTTTVPVWAGSNNLTDGASNVVNYDFGSGGWTKLNGTPLALDRGGESDSQGLDGTYDLSGITSARYIGLEILSSWNEDQTNHPGEPFGNPSLQNGQLVGLNQVAFSVIPEPSTALLGGIGVLLFLRRRRLG